MPGAGNALRAQQMVLNLDEFNRKTHINKYFRILLLPAQS